MSRRYFSLTILSLLLSLATFAQKEELILQVGETNVTKEEFAYVYGKNSGKRDSAYTKESLYEYLDLYTKFRLKVAEAEAQQLDTNKAFITEFSGYKKQLAEPYFTDAKIVDSLAHQAYERMMYQVKASHLLVEVAQNATPEDTLAAYNKIVEIRQEIVTGMPFGEAAIKYSDDPSARSNSGQRGAKGDLGYFSAFAMVYEFEEAAYTTPVGEVSQPIRTKFGYHLVYVTDKRKSEGEVQVAHIMVSAPEDIDPEEDALAKAKIDSVYSLLQNGADWKSTCLTFSDHTQTKSSGGMLKPFKRDGSFGVPEFEEVAFSLKNEGDISKPFRTSYGWHVIKLVHKKQLDSFEEMQPELKRRVSKGARGKLNKQAVIARLKEENSFKSNAKLQQKVFASIDSTVLTASWKRENEAKLNSKTMFSIEKQKFSVEGFYKFVEKNQSTSDKPLTKNQALEALFKEYSDKAVLDYEEAHLEEKYFDYKMLLKEYREGMLLFELMQKEVWSKAAADSAGIQAYYDAHQEEYVWGKRAKMQVVECPTMQIAESIKKELDAGELKTTTITDRYNGLKLKEETKEIKRLDQGLGTSIQKGTVFIQEVRGQVYLYIVEDILPEEQKKLEETRGMVISDYQSEVEENWLEELAKKYPVVIYDEVVLSLVK